MIYAIITILLFVSISAYFYIAKKFNIVDKPNQRSSHTQITIRGGGIVYWIAATAYFCGHVMESWMFFLAICIIAIISFFDDIFTIDPKPRLIFHLAAMTLLGFSMHLFSIMPSWAIVIGYIVFIGILNAYNFMDGINGMTGIYSLVVLIAMQYVNHDIHFVNPDFIWYPIIASIVFLFFNFRKKAKCFAGDVGSVTIAFWIVALLIKLMIETKNMIWILFLAVYGVDTICTIMHRLYLKQNIFAAHRMHFYQILANENHIPHLVISSGYAVTQAIICAFVIFAPLQWYYITAITIIPLLIIYTLKFKHIKTKSDS